MNFKYNLNNNLIFKIFGILLISQISIVLCTNADQNAFNINSSTDFDLEIENRSKLLDISKPKAAYEIASGLKFKNKIKSLNYYTNSSQIKNDKQYGEYLARLLFEMGFEISAIKTIERILDVNQSQWFYEYFGDQFIKSNNFTLAIKILDEGQRIYNSNLLQWLKIKLISNSYPEEAIKLFENINQQSLNTEQLILYFSLLFNLKKYDQANKILLDSNDYIKKPRIVDRLLLLYSILGYSDKFLELIDKAKKLYPENIFYYFSEANYWKENGNLDKAIQILDEAYLINPNYQNLIKLKVDIYIEKNNIEEIIDELEYLVFNNVNSVKYYLVLARYYFRNSRPFESEKIILQGLDRFFYLNLNNSIEYQNLVLEFAVISEQIKNYRQAILAYQSLIEINPKNIYFHFGLSRNFYKNEDNINAVKHIEISINNLSNEIDQHMISTIYSYYIEILINNDEINKAQKQLIIYTNQNQYLWSHQLQARIYLYYHQYDMILLEIDKYVQNGGKINTNILLLQAIAYEGLMDYENLLATLKKFNKGVVTKFITITNFRLEKNINKRKSIINQYLKKYQPDLAFVEINAYLNEDHKKRSWNNSKLILSLFKKIIEGEEYNTELNNIPENWQPYFLALIKSLSINHNLPIYPINAEKNDRLWKKYYQLYAANETLDENWLFNIIEKEKIEKVNDPIFNGIILQYFEKNEDYEGCIKSGNKFLNEFNQNVWALIKVSICYDFLKLGKEASDYLNKAKKIDESNPTILNNLAWLYLTTNDQSLHNPKLALELAKQAVNADPNSAFLDTLAEAYFQNNNFDLAKQAIQKSLINDVGQSDHFKRQLLKIDKALQNNN